MSAFFVMLAICVGAVSASGDGNAYDFPSYTFLPDQEGSSFLSDEPEINLILFGSHWDTYDGEETISEDFIRLKAEDGHDLRSFIDTPEKRENRSLEMLRFAEWNGAVDFLAAYNQTEIETVLEEYANGYPMEIVISSKDSDINEEISGSFDAPIYFDVDGAYLLGADMEDDRIVMIILNDEMLYPMDNCQLANEKINEYAEQCGFRPRDDLSSMIWFHAQYMGNMEPIAELNEDYITMKEVRVKVDPVLFG